MAGGEARPGAPPRGVGLANARGPGPGAVDWPAAGGTPLAYAHFERLSALDLSFLAMEDGRAHMHIGSVSIFDAAPLRGEDGGLDFPRLLAFVEAQLHKVPRLRQKLVWVPGVGQPVWVDDLAEITAQVAARDNLGGEVIKIGGAQEITLKGAVRAIMKAAGRRRPLISLPVWVMKPAAYACEKLFKRPPITRDQLAMLLDGGYTCEVPPLIEQFGVDLKSFDKGLEKLFEKK